jgi:CheY-like chemotaxis protein
VREKVQDEPTQRLLDIMETSALRVAEAVRQIMACSRGTSGHKTQVASRRLLDDVIEKVRGSLSPDVPLEVSVGSDLFPVKGNLDHLKEALLNICANAREAMPDGGMLKVTAENCLLDRPFADSLPELRPGAYIRIQVSDTGRGIPPGNLNKVFDPFFTTKPFGLSRGLGLSVALGMVRSHDGGIQIRSELGRGTTVTVYLPAIPVVVPPLTAAAPGPTRKASGKAILLVDDDPEVRAITKTVLELLGHRVITADSGELGLAEFVRYRPAVRAVVTDTAMPGMGGVSLVRTLREMAPEVPIISATGSGEEEKITELKRLGVSRVLQKPYLVSQLVSALEAILGESAP